MNIFVSLYDLNFTIDKLWWDLDAPSIEKGRVEARRQEDKLKELNIPYISVFTAGKGFHFYVPTIPYKPKSISEGNTIFNDIIPFLTDGINYIDRISQDRQMVRVPNTVNPKTGSNAIYVDLKTFKVEDAYKVSHIPNILYRSDLLKLWEMTDFGNKTPKHNATAQREGISHSIPSNMKQFLEPLLRPCIFDIISNDSNPVHVIREELAAELFWIGYGVDKIVEIMSRLNWKDWDEKLTRYHVNKITDKELIPRTCKNMEPYVNCTRCGYNYYWDQF